MGFVPELTPVQRGGARLWLDDSARAAGWLVAFTRRDGGASRRPYDSLNLALRVGDHPVAVEENRRRVARSLGFDPERLALARQIHGADVVRVRSGENGIRGEADVLTTDEVGPVLAVLTADCAPIVIAGGDSVAVVHAGWRGLVAGAIERGIEAVGDARAAWVGPAIGACCYQVGPEVVDAFVAAGLPVAREDRVDIGAAAQDVLETNGIPTARVVECTSSAEGYFSYRRDGITGRQGAFAARLG